jgi:anti-sigma regulatory factor (Ser/Thr protein kinase)
MLGGIAELLQLDPELLDDVKTAVSEACNNVVMHAYEGASGPLRVSLYAAGDGLEVIVRDQGRGIPVLAPSDDRLQGVGIPIMRALAQQTAFRPCEGGGTEVWLQFPSERDGRPLYTLPGAAIPQDGWSDRLPGDAVVSLSPINFVGGVLGRLARAMAARARFSLDRFSDVYLVTDAIAAHAVATARSGRVAFSIDAEARRLEISVGPLAHGSSAAVRAEARVTEPESALLLLSDTVDGVPLAGGEMLRVVMTDAPRPAETV